MKKTERAMPGNVFEDIGFTRAEALELKVKSEIYRELLKHIRTEGLSQTDLRERLGVHQPDASHLMTGKVSRFSVGKLIQFAGKLNLDAKVKVTPAKGATKINVSAQATRPSKTKQLV